MKELEQQQKDVIEIVKQTKQEKKQVLIGTIRPHQNHLLYELNTKTGVVELAKFKVDDIVFSDTKDVERKKKVIVNESCLYVTALNIKNAKKKFIKMTSNPTKQ